MLKISIVVSLIVIVVCIGSSILLSLIEGHKTFCNLKLIYLRHSIRHIASIVSGSFLQFHQDDLVEHLLTDSRRLVFPETSLFFALQGPRRDGDSFIPELYLRGVRNFVVCHDFDLQDFPEANFILVKDSLQALQALAAFHRQQFDLPVVGITGSNGKTIVKEWLNQLLEDRFQIVRSPRSYNSQIGVPLSIWQISEQHELALIEAGISQVGEMQFLEEMIKPDIGVLTNIGGAHDQGFENTQSKIREKLELFKNSECPDLSVGSEGSQESDF